MSLDFIYFDVGGVAIKDMSGTNKWDEILDEIGVDGDKKSNFNNLYTIYEHELNVGKDMDTLIPIFEEKFNIKFSDNYSWLDAIVNRFERNDGIWPIINEVKKRYKIGLLTNMYPNMLNKIADRKIIDLDIFDVIIDSSIVKAEKPTPEIYKIAEEKSDMRPDQLIFIDNILKNVEGAKNHGWQGTFFDVKDYEASNEKIRNLLLEK